MDEEDWEALLAVAKRRHYRKNQFVFEAGESGVHLYLLVRGRVKVFKLSPAGREIILWYCLPGDLFGLAETLSHRPREVHAQLCDDTELFEVSQEGFETFLAARPRAAMRLLGMVSRRLRLLGDMVADLASDDAAARLAKLLHRLTQLYGQPQEEGVLIAFPLTHQELADMVGATRQTVTTLIGRMRRERLVSIRNRRLLVHDQGALVALGEGR